MFTLFSFVDFIPAAEFLVGAIPAVIFAGVCVFGVYCMATNDQEVQAA